MEHCKLNITLATGVVGWNTLVNKQLLIELAKNPTVKVTGLVPSSTVEQKEQARELNVELVDGRELDGFSPKERLSFPPDQLEIDVLIMHSYGLHEGKHAQVIRETKKCKWFHIIHTISEELAKYMDKKYEQEKEHQLQLKLSQKADSIIAVGPKVADTFRSELRHCGKSNDVIDLTPGIVNELVGVRPVHLTGEKFRILISGTWFAKYYRVKGLDIAARAMRCLQEASCHLICIINPDEDTKELNDQLLKEGIELDQFTVRPFESGNLENWKKLLCEVDLIIMPSRTEGFGTTNLRAISADLPVLVNQNCGLGMALKKLPSGAKHVMKSNDPKVWADSIKKVQEKSPEDQLSEAKQLRQEYEEKYSLEKQCNSLVERMLTLFPSRQVDFKEGVEHSEEFEQERGQYPEVQSYETETMVHEERMLENVNHRGQELRPASEKKSSQAEKKAYDEEMVAVQRQTEKLSIGGRKTETERVNYKEKVETVQGGSHEVGHAAVMDIKEERNGFDQVDSVGAALDSVNDKNSNRDQARISNTRQSIKAEDIPFSILSKICLKLNIRKDLSFNDFRLLGEKMKFSNDVIRNLGQRENPTYELLQLWYAKPEATVEKLITLLKEDDMERWDVATILENWLKNGN